MNKLQQQILQAKREGAENFKKYGPTNYWNPYNKKHKVGKKLLTAYKEGFYEAFVRRLKNDKDFCSHYHFRGLFLPKNLRRFKFISERQLEALSKEMDQYLRPTRLDENGNDWIDTAIVQTQEKITDAKKLKEQEKQNA
ncbi:hypothetical protein [Vibrio phage vB_VmeM-Yong XC32]|nr:hypothetical protein [Vibrio phage vB_VmeM-Yong XC31]QAX96583.1 hypothetical protein [Vibrio phage vB_VmeM-Yong XC32]QAX96901.1 hypothetical protein [Vibrio phage vB_VmeM-Yong MS31]QAX97206.1 hypothetical protein [Vibrio phage vB_VmeM-Yong MS32]